MAKKRSKKTLFSVPPPRAAVAPKFLPAAIVPIIEAGYALGSTWALDGAALAALGTGAQPKPQEDAQRQLAPGKIRIKRDLTDNQRVLKVADALDCLEESLSATNVIKTFLADMGNRLVGRVPASAGASFLQDLADPIAACIRRKVLSQDNPRRVVEKKVYTRKP